MNSSTTPTDELAVLRMQKKQLRRELKASRKKISDISSGIFSPDSDSATGKAYGISKLMANGMAVYEGIRLGMNVLSAFRKLFGKKRRRF